MASPSIPAGSGIVILDWRFTCETAPAAQTLATICIGCNIAISIRILSPGDAGDLAQSIAAATLPAAPVPPLLPSPAGPPVSPVSPATTSGANGGLAADPPFAPDAGSGEPFGGRSSADSLEARSAQADELPRRGAPESYGAPGLRDVRLGTAPAPATELTRFAPVWRPAAAFRTSGEGMRPEAAARSGGSRHGAPPPAEQLPRHLPFLPPSEPLGAVATAAVGGASHGGHAGATGAAVLLAALLASLFDVSRRLVPQRMRLVLRPGPGRLERPG